MAIRLMDLLLGLNKRSPTILRLFGAQQVEDALDKVYQNHKDGDKSLDELVTLVIKELNNSSKKSDKIAESASEEETEERILAKLLRVINSVSSPEQLTSAKKYLDLVLRKCGALSIRELYSERGKIGDLALEITSALSKKEKKYTPMGEGQIYSTGGGAGQSYRKFTPKVDKTLDEDWGSSDWVAVLKEFKKDLESAKNPNDIANSAYEIATSHNEPRKFRDDPWTNFTPKQLLQMAIVRKIVPDQLIPVVNGIIDGKIDVSIGDELDEEILVNRLSQESSVLKGLVNTESKFLKKNNKKDVAEGKKKRKKKSSKSMRGYFFPGYAYYGGENSGEASGDGGGGESVNHRVAENEVIKLSPRSQKAKDWIAKVYAKYPGTWQNNHVMTWGEGDDQELAFFELVPSLSSIVNRGAKGAVEIKWFQAYPLRKGIGSRAIKELQQLAREDNITLVGYPWDKGAVSQKNLMKFYMSHGFKPTTKGGKNLIWEPQGQDVTEGDVIPFKSRTWESIPKEVRQFAAEWYWAHAVEDGPEMQNLKRKISLRGFNIDYDYDGENIELKNKKTGKVTLLPLSDADNFTNWAAGAEPGTDINEDLRKWFKEKWVRFGPDGKIRGACARGSKKEGKPKCLPQSKAHALGKKGRKYAANKKRREDPNPERSGKAINVATKKKSNEGVAEGQGDQMSKTKALNALRRQLMDTYEYMRCANLEEFKQRLQWLSEGMLKNHMTDSKSTAVNMEEIELYKEYREKREQIQRGSTLQGVTEDAPDWNKLAKPSIGTRISGMIGDIRDRRQRRKYEALTKKFYEMADEAMDKAHEYDFDDLDSRGPHEADFSKYMEFARYFAMLSGKEKPHAMFLDRMRKEYPELAKYVQEGSEGVTEGTEQSQSLSSMASQDQSERYEYENFVKSQAGGDWSKGAKMYAQLKKRPSDDIFGDTARLNQFMKIKFDFDKFTKKDWENYWLLAQHCDKDRNFQKNALSIIKKYQGTDHKNYKYLYDRISMGLTGKQKYGTQNELAEQGVAKNSLTEFAGRPPDGDDGEEFDPGIAKLAQEDGWSKGVSLSDHMTLVRAMAIQHWHTVNGGMYIPYFADGFKKGRMNKINHANTQYNRNLKLMKDGSIRDSEQGVTEEQLDELKCWDGYHRVKGTKAGFPGSCAKNKSVKEEHQQCPECGGAMYEESMINEKKDACYYKVKSRYKVWPSAYASGALVKCRKKGAKNWGNKSSKSNESIVEDTKEKCPEATLDISVNLENRQKAIKEYGYGPLNPNLPNDKFWSKKVEMWELDNTDDAKKSLCGNCAAFDVRKFTLDCIAKGIGDDERAAEDVIKVGQLGYCRFLKFKCASKRTCDAWVVGGPLNDKKVKQSTDENKGLPMPGTYEQEYNMFKSKGPERIIAMTNESDAKKTFVVVYYSKKTDRNVTKQVQANNESEVWDALQSKDIQVVSVKEKGVAEGEITEKWSAKYKRSINCNNPKGFSQRAHCQGRKKKGNK